MLRELSVQNLALIEDVHVELEDGYCAWTGETGAGKSLLLTALGLVLGGKASGEMVRSGKDEARAAAVFDVGDAVLKAEIESILGGSLEDDELIITRRITVAGPGQRPRQRAARHRRHAAEAGRVPGRHPRPARGPRLARRVTTARLLDAYGGLGRKGRCLPPGAVRRTKPCAASGKIWSIPPKPGDRERALLEFERDELAAALPKSGEYDELAREAHLLKNADQIRSTAAAGYALLYEADRSAQDLLTRVARSLDPLSEAVTELAVAVSTLERLADETREVAFSLRELAQGWDDDPARLEDLETRMAVYRRLATRFHCTPDELADRLTSSESKLDSIERDDTDLLALDRAAGRGLARIETHGRAAHEGAREARQGLSPGDPGTAEAARSRRPRGCRSPSRHAISATIRSRSRLRNRGPTRSRCCSRRIPARSRDRCARLPRAASSRG